MDTTEDDFKEMTGTNLDEKDLKSGFVPVEELDETEEGDEDSGSEQFGFPNDTEEGDDEFQEVVNLFAAENDYTNY